MLLTVCLAHCYVLEKEKKPRLAPALRELMLDQRGRVYLEIQGSRVHTCKGTSEGKAPAAGADEWRETETDSQI